MNCPNCAAPLEREDRVEPYIALVVDQVTTLDCPHAIYACEDCGGEWIWRRGRRLEPLFDPRADNVPDQVGMEVA